MTYTVVPGHRQPGRMPTGHRGRRQDRHRPERRRVGAAVRLVHLVRPGRRPAGRGRRDDPEGPRHRARRDRRRRARRPDRQGRHGGGDQAVTATGPSASPTPPSRYRLDSRIATGGMGEVWRATDTRLGRTVAVKLLKHEYADDATFRTRFTSEAQHAAALHHPGVAAVYDYGGRRRATPYLVMELVDGQPLSALIAPGRPMDPDGGARPDGAGRRRDRRRPRRRHRPPRRQAGQPAGHARPPDQDHRLRHRAGRRGDGADPDRPGHGDAPVPLARAGAGRHGHARLRRLLARGRGVRVPGRPPAVRRRDAGRDRARPPARAGPGAAAGGPVRPRRRRTPGDVEGPRRPVRRRLGARRRVPRPRHGRDGRRAAAAVPPPR